MDDLIGLLVFAVIAIFGVAARYKESQRAKKDLAPPPPPKPRQPLPRQQLPENTLWHFERRDIRTARPASAPREARPPRPAPLAQRPLAQRAPQPRPATQARVPAPPRPAPAERPAAARKPPQPAFVEEDTGPRVRPEHVRAQQKPAMREHTEVMPAPLRAGRQAAREALQHAVEQESDTGFETAAAARERRTTALPPLFRNMQGIRAGIVFSEIIAPPVALR